MTTNSSFTTPSPMSSEQEDDIMDYGTPPSCTLWFYIRDLKLAVISTFHFFVCIFGLLGNGTVIWLLGFRMKRNPFTTYILNLAAADFGVLISVIPEAVWHFFASTCEDIFLTLLFVTTVLFNFMFSISQFLLTAISIDRCVSVLFPLWYRCHRPEKLSTILCALIWIFCFLVHGILIAFYVFGDIFILYYVFLVNAVVCLPLLTSSTMILFIRFCFKSQQRQRGKLLMAIILALFFFLFLAFPLNVIYLIYFLPLFSDRDYSVVSMVNLSVGYLCASLNSCINPVIYFLVGKKKKSLCTENVKLILQRVFKQEDEVYGEELQPSVQTKGHLLTKRSQEPQKCDDQIRSRTPITMSCKQENHTMNKDTLDSSVNGI